MAATYKLISAVTVGAGGTSTLSFTSIPQTYDNLLIQLNSRNSRSTAGPGYGTISINSTTTGFYASSLGQYNSGTGDTGGIVAENWSTNYLSYSLGTDAMSSNSFGTAVIYIPSYKVAYSKIIYIDATNGGSSLQPYYQQATGLAWSGTDPITDISIGTSNAPFLQYTTAHLYGISNS